MGQPEFLSSFVIYAIHIVLYTTFDIYYTTLLSLKNNMKVIIERVGVGFLAQKSCPFRAKASVCAGLSRGPKSRTITRKIRPGKVSFSAHFRVEQKFRLVLPI